MKQLDDRTKALILNLIKSHDGAWGQMDLDDALQKRGLGLIHVPTTIARLAREGLVELSGDLQMISTRYSITETGRAFLTKSLAG